MLFVLSPTSCISFSHLPLRIEEFIRKDPSRQNLNLSSAAPTTPAPPTAAIASTSGQAAAPSDASKRPRSDAAADDPAPAPLHTERKRRRAASAADGADLDEFGPYPTPKVRRCRVTGFAIVTLWSGEVQ
jgi:hypothetical protein